MEFRRATVDDAQSLSQMVLAGVTYWGHHANYPEAFEDLRANHLPDVDFIRANLVEVLVEGGVPVGFYSLSAATDYVELVHMFVVVDRIGRGYGRQLWDRALEKGRQMAARMLVMADPRAKDFYAAMGAELETDVEVSPGFFLGRMWFEFN